MLVKPDHYHPMLIEIIQEGLLDLEKISELPLLDSDSWREAIAKQGLRIKDFFVVGE
jgi:hypothetical protein